MALFRKSEFAQLPEMNDTTIRAALGLPEEYSLAQFRFYNIAQALLFTTKQDRMSEESEVMKICDLGDEKQAEAMVQNYVMQMHQTRYNADLRLKRVAETQSLNKLLVKQIIESETMDEVVNLFKNGLTKSQVSTQILNTTSMGFAELKQQLLDLSIPVQQRVLKLCVLLLGCSKEHGIIWNNGNVLQGVRLTEFENVFVQSNAAAKWQRVYEVYKKRLFHVYRTKTPDKNGKDGNRHGHSNTKPSYWSKGFKTMKAMKDAISEEEYTEYCQKHHNCCGN
jgi:hypothetical protein